MIKKSSYKHLLKITLTSLLLTMLFNTNASAQFYAIKTDALGLLTGSVNADASMALNEHYTIHLHGQYNPWTYSGNKKFKNITVLPGLRYWRGETYGYGWFAGVNAIYSHYNVGGFFGGKNRYQGDAYGAGVSIGYSIPIRKRLNIEFEIGGGIVYTQYGKYKCTTCGTKISDENKFLVVPSKAAVSIVYLF